LIENSRQRVGVLEDMARTIYREWFVHFRYPGHESVPVVDSLLGPIPEGWVVGALGDLAVEVRDSVKRSDETRSLPYVPIDEMDSRSLTLYRSRPGDDAASSLRMFKEGDILFGAMRAYFHKVCLAPFDGVTRSTCFVLRSSPSWRVLPLFYLDDDDTVAYASNHSSGSTIPYAKWSGVLSERRVALPPAPLAEAFSDVAEPMLAQARALASQIRTLAALRDLLLPKLVTGQIDVSGIDLDTLLGESAA
jgi:type I restriction enzyme S subunit